MRFIVFFTLLCLLQNVSKSQDLRIVQDEPYQLAQPVPFYSGQTLSVNRASYTYNNFGMANSPLIDYLAGQHTRKQLEFTDKQNQEFKEIQKEYSKAFQAMYADFPELKNKDLPREARNELNRKVRLASQKLRKEFSEKVKETLVPHQIEMVSTLKFKQTVQAFGFAYAVSNGPFAEELKTTAEQKKALAKIRQDTQKAIREKTEELKAESKKKMLKVFDAKQRKILKEFDEGTSK